MEEETDPGGGPEACEEGEAGEGGTMGGACEGGEEVGDAGGCIAACKSLASRRPAADAFADRQASWSLHHESISLGASANPSAFEFPRVSVCRLVRRVFVRPSQVTHVTSEHLAASVSACLEGRLALGELSPSVGLVWRRKAAGRSKTRREEGACVRSQLQV